MGVYAMGAKWRASGWDTLRESNVHIGMFETRREAQRAVDEWKRSNRRPRRKARPPERVSQAVYRCYDASGLLIYVGAASSRLGRFMQHEGSTHWWSEVVQIAVEHYADRHDALVAEAHAIELERPLHNRALDRSLLVHPRPEPVSTAVPPSRTASEAELLVAQIGRLVNNCSHARAHRDRS